jgi:glycosyltransferase involved in cell wall biosynthesis
VRSSPAEERSGAIGAPARAAPGPQATPAPVTRGRLAVVGLSLRDICGVRDHATLLAQALRSDGFGCSMHWLTRTPRPFRDARAEVHAWARELAGSLRQERPDAVLLHYSAFAYSHRGVPLFLHPVLRAVRGVPLVTIMHELVYPWSDIAWRGKVWAASQRACLVELVRASAGVVVTADFQQRWLQTRRWLPHRSVRTAPVFSNLPAPRARPARDHRDSAHSIGVFGYAYQGARIDAVLAAGALLRDRGLEVRLVLLGAPGGSSPVAQELLEQARTRGVEQMIVFEGPLPAQELSDALARCDVLVFADGAGPSSRKGTLAAALASGTAVVALDGPQTWQELVRSGAVELVAPDTQTLADTLARLLADDELRRALAARGAEFSERRMGVGHTADAVSSLLRELAPTRSSAPAR